MEKLKTPPKPHFFMPLVSQNFRNELVIPYTFFTKYVDNGGGCQKALLKTSRGNKVWEVWMNKGTLADGWRDFVEHNDLHKGEILVFGYEGNLSFHVFIFDPTACEREYPHDDGICSVEEVEQSESEAFKTPKDNEGPNEIEKRCNKKRRTEANKTSSSTENPYFVATLTPSYLRCKLMMIPTSFSNLYDLHGRIWREVIIRDQKHRIWTIEIKHKTGNQFYFRNGWHDFCVGNSLKEGVSLKLELTSVGNRPCFNFHLSEGSSMTNRGEFSKAEANSFKEFDRRCVAKKSLGYESKNWAYNIGDSYFHGIISRTILTKCQMLLPRSFTESKGLSGVNCNKIIKLRKINGGTWQVLLRYCKENRHTYLGSGWAAFASENKLQAGDKFKLELAKDTEDGTLIMNYYGYSKEVCSGERSKQQTLQCDS